MAGEVKARTARDGQDDQGLGRHRDGGREHAAADVVAAVVTLWMSSAELRRRWKGSGAPR